MKTAALVLALAALCPAQDQPPVDWIRANAIPLETVDPGNGFADLQPLKKLVGDARIVQLGEATHGTREFFRMKHRMLEFLATEMGFNIFSIEANMPESYRLNDYVLNGNGDPAALLKGIYFWTWNTEEVLEMIRWMREFNASGRGRVQFTGFDMQIPIVAAQVVGNFLSAYDPEYAAEGRTAIGIATRQYLSRAYAVGYVALQRPGAKLRLSGFVKTDKVTRGYALMSCAVLDSAGRILSTDTQRYRSVPEMPDWRRIEIGLDIPEGARHVYIAANHAGDGTAWFDSLALEVDGAPYPTGLDLGFESRASGFTLGGGEAYNVDLDGSTAHTGRQSLRMRWTGASARDAAYAAHMVVEHMEAARDGWVASGLPEWDVEWAIQNARVVEQAAGIEFEASARDRSMALNAKWILDRNPGAKMVVWAHDLHVAESPLEGWTPMGSSLKEFYGDGVFTFGFAFNQGSFQAISPKGLQEYTVEAAAPETLDGALAATGLPMFILPFGADAPEWLRAPQPKREIGAGFADGAYVFGPLPAARLWDALIFVDRTTRARPNP